MSGYDDVSSFTDPLLAYEHIKENPDKYSLLIIDDKMPNSKWVIHENQTLRNKSKTKCNYNE